jgi:hypothetical protein
MEWVAIYMVMVGGEPELRVYDTGEPKNFTSRDDCMDLAMGTSRDVVGEAIGTGLGWCVPRHWLDENDRRNVRGRNVGALD